MSGPRLQNIQWRFIKYAIWLSLVTALVCVGLVVYMEGIDVRHMVFNRLLGVPYGIVLLVLIFIVGATFGYLFGNHMKKRLEVLVGSILRFERGNYSHRAPDLGEDEIGQVAIHLNQMAEQIERQVASLQKLSSERAEWNEELKRAAIEEERQRLARELHDAVSQQLFAISMLSSAVRETYVGTSESTAKQLETIEKMAGLAQNEMRALLLHLRPASLDGKGLKEGIEELLVEFQAKQPLDIKWKIDEIGGLPKGVEDHVFRIVQEALSNILRHAKADNVSVRLNRFGRQLHLKIIDDGIGFDVSEQKASSYGLKSIYERVSEIGGVAEIVSLQGKGTQIDVKVPLVEEMERP